jgi:hypothetical protein
MEANQRDKFPPSFISGDLFGDSTERPDAVLLVVLFGQNKKREKELRKQKSSSH